jgi:hypothetical protein
MSHTNNTPAQQILNLMDSRIDEMVVKIVSAMVKECAEKNQSFKPTGRDLEIIKYGLVIDLLKSVEKYTLSTDVIVKLSECISPKGFIIYATIQREGKEYIYSTDVITAGGYNIQCLHYRYITNTNLPRVNASFDMLNKMKEGLKRVKAEKRLEEQIEYKKAAIERLENDLKNLLAKTEEEVVSSFSFHTKKYEDLNEGHTYGTKENFLKEQNKSIEYYKNRHLSNIKYTRSYIQELYKDIEKITLKFKKIK